MFTARTKSKELKKLFACGLEERMLHNVTM
jgi:hypothetical protein